MANEIRTGIRLEGDASGAKAAFEQARQGAKEFEGQVDRSTNSSEQLAASFKKLIGVVAGWQMGRQFVETADAMTNMQSRMKMVTSGANEMAYVQGRLFDIAQQSRISFLELGGTYAQIARATSALGVSQGRLLTVTESIGQAMTIGGGSAQSMQAALVQLSQGLASGTLRGEELNSIMEQTPRLAQAIADGMGISLGQLRAYGQDGKLSALAVVEALEKAGPGLKREFEQVTVTVGGAMTALGNSGARFVNEFDKATGASSAMASAIKTLGSGVDSLATSIGSNKGAWEILAGSASWAVSLGAVALVLPRVAAGVVMVGAAMAAHPVLLGLMAVAAIGGAIYAGYKKLNEVKPDTTAKNREDFMRFERGQQNAEDAPPYPGAKPLEEVRKYGKLVVDVQRETYEQSVNIAKSYQNRIKLATSDEERVALTREMNERLVQINRDAAREIKSINEQGAAEARQLMEAQFSQRKAGMELVASAERYAINERQRSNEQFYRLGLLNVEDYYQRKAALEVEDIDISARLVQAELAQAAAIANSTKKVEDKLQAQARVLNLERQLVDLAGRRRAALDEPGNQDALAARQERMNAQRHAAELNRISIGLIKDPLARERARMEEEARVRMEAITNMPQGKAREAATERFNEWVVAKNDELAERLKPGYQKMLEQWSDTTRLMRDTYNNTMEGMLRAGEDEFARSSGNLISMASAMSKAVEQEIMRMIFRLGAASVQSGMGGMFSFGGGEQPIPIDGYHTGGMVGGEPTFRRAVHPAVFRGAPRFHTGGITGDEVPIIAKRGEGVFTPGQMKALGDGMGGASVALNVTVINNTDAQVRVQQKPGGSGLDLEVLVDMVDAGLADRAGAGQGRLLQTMANRFGMREAVN